MILPHIFLTRKTANYFLEIFIHCQECILVILLEALKVCLLVYILLEEGKLLSNKVYCNTLKNCFL